MQTEMGMEEVVADGIDSDCDEKELCLRDQDADGYSDGELIATVDFTCEGYGLTLLDGDCDVPIPIFIQIKKRSVMVWTPIVMVSCGRRNSI